MGQTINPAVSGNHQYLKGSIGFIGGAIVGAVVSTILVFILIHTANAIHPLGGAAVAVAMVGLAMLREVRTKTPLPYRSKQVPEYWRHEFSLGMVGTLYGIMLGAGFLTPFVSSAHLAALVAASMQGTIVAILLVSVSFALGRASTLLSGIGAKALDELDERIEVAAEAGGRRLLVRRAAGLVASVTVLAAVVSRGVML
jgi:hypothetical protein